MLCGNVGIGARGQRGRGHSEKRRVHLAPAAGNLHFLSLVVGQSQAHHKVSAFARQRIGGDGPAVQRIGNIHGHGRRLRCGALIINIVVLGGPGQVFAVLRGQHVAFQVGDAGECAAVRRSVKAGIAVQPVADDLFAHRTVRVQDQKHIFVFRHALCGLFGKGGQGAGDGQCRAYQNGRGFLQ